MFTKISVLVPTRHRTKRLETLLGSFDTTVKKGGADLVFRVDEDDQETQSFMMGNSDYRRWRMVVGLRHQGYRSMPLFFNELFIASTGDVLMCGNDDMVFKTDGWPGKLLEVANKYPDGLFDLGVSTLNETHYPFSVVSKKAAETMGHLWDPSIFWGDIFLRDVMASFGRAMMVPEVVIDHDWAGYKPDQVFAESPKIITNEDPTYWSGTHVKAVNLAVSRLRTFMPVATTKTVRELGFAYD